MVSAIVDELDDPTEGEAGMFDFALDGSTSAMNEWYWINSGSTVRVMSR